MHEVVEVRWATAADLELVTALEDKVYEPADRVPRELARSWFGRNDRMIRLLVGPGDAFLGYSWIVPVRAPALSEFVAGRLTEWDFRAEDIATPEETFACEEMYLCSLAMVRRQRRALPVLVEDLTALLEEYRTKGRLRRLYAIAASVEGRNLLRRHLGFRLLVPGSQRRDGHDAYIRELGPAKQ